MMMLTAKEIPWYAISAVTIPITIGPMVDQWLEINSYAWDATPMISPIQPTSTLTPVVIPPKSCCICGMWASTVSVICMTSGISCAPRFSFMSVIVLDSSCIFPA
ncbi:MAG: hypothetical protein FWF44_10840, partial [Defluviitaleaceae bacterium]|nr:hypothetical protein [Defluviitaleaceae bacterium]